MYKLQYFHFGNDICANDLKKEPKIEHINLQQISSISGINKFIGAFSGEHKGSYAIVSMQNGDRFYIPEEEQLKLIRSMQT